MKTLRNIIIALAALGIISGTAKLVAHPLTYYGYLTDRSRTEFGVIIWFWTPDTFFSPVHSNDYIGLKYSPTFYDSVSTCKSEFFYYQPGNIHFEYEPVFNAPSVNIPYEMPHLENMANISIESGNGRFMTVMRFRGEEGIFIYQYPMGSEPRDSLVRHLDPPRGSVVYVDGDLEMEGSVLGKITVYASGDIGLPDDLKYYGSARYTGDFDQDTTTSMIGVVAKGNIVILDTYENGKENGRDVGGADWDRHSIILNGSFIALGESFTFEHQNDEWDGYQGPTPDERGWIYLVGGIAQKRQGYVHRGNHTGTGYGKAFRYDQRLRTQYPVGLSPEYLPGDGNYDRLVYSNDSYLIEGKRARTVIVEAGAELDLIHNEALIVTDTLIMRGTERQPIRVFSSSGMGGIRVADSAFVQIEHTDFDADVTLRFDNSTTSLRNCTFASTPFMSGTISIDSCQFESRLEHHWTGTVEVRRSSFDEHGIAISGNDSHLRLNHVTIAGGNGTGVEVSNGAEAEITNSVVAFLRRGVQVSGRSSASVSYSNAFGNTMGDFIDYEPGEGCISADPDFVDQRNGNLSLLPGSPCIDAGDPASPRDPDGTVADLGAYWLDRGLGNDDDGDAADDDGDADAEGGGGLSASPNPFNATTVIRFGVGARHAVPLRIAIHDLAGREVFSTNALLHSGTNALSWDATAFPAGIYIVRVGNGKEAKSMKILKVN